MITAYYDLKTSPPTFDFVAFLMATERERLRRGEDKISISILPGPNGGFRQDRFWPHSIEEREQTLHRIVVPMARMLSSVSEVTMRQDRPERPGPRSIGYLCRLYGTRLFVECMGAGIRPLRPQDDRLSDPRLVTITLREAEHWPERNSNVSQWVEAAQVIASWGFEVVVVRDTLAAGEPLYGVVTNDAAAVDLIERAQLYRSAVCNMFVNNGCGWFCMALDAPTLMLKPTVEGLMRTCSAAFFRECGIPTGGQIPGAPSYQRLVWQEDTTAAMLDAFDAFMAGNQSQRDVA